MLPLTFQIKLWFGKCCKSYTHPPVPKRGAGTAAAIDDTCWGGCENKSLSEVEGQKVVVFSKWKAWERRELVAKGDVGLICL